MIIKQGTTNEFWTDERCFITEIFNHPDYKNASIAQARVEPKTTTQAHALDCDEIYFILAGEGILHLAGQNHPLAKGDAALIHKGQNQSITNTSSESDLVFLCICIPRFAIDAYTALE